MSGAPFHSARGGHTATRLPDGRVLVVGGGMNPHTQTFDASGLLPHGIELFDPAGRPPGALFPRAWRTLGHTATSLADGRVLILGGRDEAMHWRGTRLFDPRGGRWTFPVGPPDLRSNHTATLLTDGTVLVVGGQITSVPSARGQALRFDPATSAFRASGRVPTTLPEHTATRLADGAVLLVGGAVALRFDPARDRFDPLPASPRQGSAAVRLADGRVLLVGGASPDAVDTPAPAVLFDPRVARFVPTASPAVARRDFIAARLADGRVLIAGGYGLRGTPLASAEVFDPATGRWCDAAPMDSPRASHAAVTLADGRVLVVGGAAEGAAMDRYVRSTEVYGELP